MGIGGALAARMLRTRALVRAPIGFYRRGLGSVFGQELLMLEHRGRSSGKIRQVVLEVAGRTESGGYLVVSGFGSKAQWLRNITADPRVLLSCGPLHRVRAVAIALDPAAAASAIADYQQRKPKSWQTLAEAMTKLGTDLNQLPVVAVTPLSRDRSTSQSQ
ncbi:MAG: nitroreductase family deazaflavin-dependent oxidoreductase [Beutenbergiaceae bacterium]